MHMDNIHVDNTYGQYIYIYIAGAKGVTLHTHSTFYLLC